MYWFPRQLPGKKAPLTKQVPVRRKGHIKRIYDKFSFMNAELLFLHLLLKSTEIAWNLHIWLNIPTLYTKDYIYQHEGE